MPGRHPLVSRKHAESCRNTSVGSARAAHLGHRRGFPTTSLRRDVQRRLCDLRAPRRSYGLAHSDTGPCPRSGRRAYLEPIFRHEDQPSPPWRPGPGADSLPGTAPERACWARVYAPFWSVFVGRATLPGGSPLLQTIRGRETAPRPDSDDLLSVRLGQSCL